jgi:hypothetical protein
MTVAVGEGDEVDGFCATYSIDLVDRDGLTVRIVLFTGDP